MTTPPYDPYVPPRPEPDKPTRLLWPPNDWEDHREAWVLEDHGGYPDDEMNRCE